MIEGKVEMEKDSIKKFIDENMVEDYIAAGWVKAKTKVNILKDNNKELKSKSFKKSLLSHKE